MVKPRNAWYSGSTHKSGYSEYRRKGSRLALLYACLLVIFFE